MTVLLALTAVGLPVVSASAALGSGDVIYGDDYIVRENENPITNDKATKENTDKPEDTKGVAVLVLVIVAAVLYGGSLAVRFVLKGRVKHEK